MSTKVNSPDDLPLNPGIYIMKDKIDNIIYIGKSKSLKKRVKSYFKEKHDSVKTQVLMNHFNSLEYIITDSEKEALILESNLIKKYRPKYNIQLKDDKRYPYVKLTNEKFPRLIITRNITKGGVYYGPFTDVGSVRATVKFLKALFKIRTCSNMDGPCLNNQIDLCYGPCDGQISQKEYKKIIKKIDMFFDGKYSKIIENLKKEMEYAALNQKYEKAGVLRDQIDSIKSVMDKQFVDFIGDLDQDIIASTQSKDNTIVVVFSIRHGKIIGKDDFLMTGGENKSKNEIISAFIQQYYSNYRHVPKEIIVEEEIADKDLILDWLSDLRKREFDKLNTEKTDKPNKTNTEKTDKSNKTNTEKTDKPKSKNTAKSNPKNTAKSNVEKETLNNEAIDYKAKIIVGENGRELRLIRMAIKNAEIIKNQKRKVQNAMIEIKKYLKLEHLPRVIEGYDVSNISGKMAVGSKVSFLDSKPNKSQYRIFKLQTPGPDDYGMMRELLSRRFKSLSSHLEEDKNYPKPDLILIDGGKGQLKIATEVLDKYNFRDIPVIGIAKEFEEIFLPNVPFPIIIPKNNDGLYLLQRVRDEAHRFGISHHRKLREKAIEASDLDNIKGVGKVRKVNLLKEFKTIQKIKDADVDEIAGVKGMNKKIATDIYNYFHEN